MKKNINAKQTLFCCFSSSEGEGKGSLPSALAADPAPRTGVMLGQPCCCLSKSQHRAPGAGLALLIPLPQVLEQVLMHGSICEWILSGCPQEERSPSTMGSWAEMLCLENSGWRWDVRAGGVEQSRAWVAQGSGMCTPGLRASPLRTPFSVQPPTTAKHIPPSPRNCP